MASFLACPIPTSRSIHVRPAHQTSFFINGSGPMLKYELSKAAYSRFRISCSAQPETLQTVQSTIAKQLSIEVSTVTPDTKFADLGADSLDTVEIMMALEEQFGVSVGEGGAENIATVQDAADLIEKVKAAA